MEATQPEFKIHGLERRELKKKLAKFKYSRDIFWRETQADKDMYFFINEDYPCSDEELQHTYDDLEKQILEMETKLTLKYNN